MPDVDVTQLLLDLEGGRREAFDLLLAKVYPDLRQIAHANLRGQRAGETLNTTGLVHEAYLKLVRYQEVNWKGRAHFFGAAAQTMRRILVDHARAKSSQKRRGEQVSLTQVDAEAAVSMDRLIEIDDALKRLEARQPRWVQVIECRYFAGLSIEETAEVLGISHGTVSNDWRAARAWLKRELGS
ncbi:MAG: sigma-70 family RNA polymerase sigma factor [Rhodothermales bacterium]